jgi:hypothetical protein
MSDPVWVVDTSSLIEIKSSVPRPDRERVFSALSALVEADRLFFPPEVLTELKRDSADKRNPEPDIVVNASDDSGEQRLTVEVRGVDVYDPTTGQIRSASTDNIACWFIDTNYNGESFFVRHAYFTGRDEPYEKLKRALRADIDEGAWSTLYCTTSRSFAPPATGKIAVKVINHYGDEVLKVYDLATR